MTGSRTLIGTCCWIGTLVKGTEKTRSVPIDGWIGGAAAREEETTGRVGATGAWDPVRGSRKKAGVAAAGERGGAA